MTAAGRPHTPPSAAGGAVSADLAHDLSEMARTLQEQGDVQATLDVIVHGAVGTIPGVQHASISAIRRRREVETLASTDEVPARSTGRSTRRSRAPAWTPSTRPRRSGCPTSPPSSAGPTSSRAQALGVGSMLAVQLFVEGDDLGALNLTSSDEHAFDDESEQVALLFAAHAAVAMSEAQQQERLRGAVATRDLVGQAKGILMERFKLTGDQAFALLVRASQTSNRKLHDIAEELVSTASLPRR